MISAARPKSASMTPPSRAVMCQFADLPLGSMLPVRIAGFEPLAVYNIDGEVHVTSDTCSHAQAFLTDGDLEGDRVVCPAHWAEFEVRSGKPLCFPATKPVTVYPAWIEDGQVLANLSSPKEGAA